MAGEWFGGGFKRAREVKEAQESGSFEFGNTEKSRFWVRVGDERQLVFLDDFEWKLVRGDAETMVVPCCHYEYKIDLANHPESWKNCIYITGSTTAGARCVPAERGFSRVYVGTMTVLDITPFKDKESGEERVVPRKRLLVGVPSALSILEAKMNKKGNLKLWQYSVTRHEKRSPRIGNDFEAVKQWTEEDLRKEFQNVNLDPLGFTAEQAYTFYEDLLKPLDVDQQEKLFNSCAPTDGWRAFKKDGKPARAPVAAGGGGAPSDDDESDDVISY